MESYIYKKFKLSEKEYKMFVDLICKSSGINLGSEKKELLKTRFQKIIRRLGLKSYQEYYNYIIRNPDSGAFSEMIDAISTNHTFFF